jgi:hypothetical protein
MRWRIAGGEARPKRQKVQKEGCARRGASERAAEEAMVEEGEGGEDWRPGGVGGAHADERGRWERGGRMMTRRRKRAGRVAVGEEEWVWRADWVDLWCGCAQSRRERAGPRRMRRSGGRG